jgi:hypothetical protein
VYVSSLPSPDAPEGSPRVAMDWLL